MERHAVDDRLYPGTIKSRDVRLSWEKMELDEIGMLFATLLVCRH